jgi:hypothetical protein
VGFLLVGVWPLPLVVGSSQNLFARPVVGEKGGNQLKTSLHTQENSRKNIDT